jgi:hypothetical protein
MDWKRDSISRPSSLGMLMSRMTRSGGIRGSSAWHRRHCRFADVVTLVLQQHPNGQADDGMIVDNKYCLHIQLPCGEAKAVGTLAQLNGGGQGCSGCYVYRKFLTDKAKCVLREMWFLGGLIGSEGLISCLWS